MWNQSLNSAVFVLALSGFSHALPGFRVFSEECSRLSNGDYSDSCSKITPSTFGLETTVSTDSVRHAITPGPALIAQAYRRDVDGQTAVCSDNVCDVYDVSSSLLTVIVLPGATSSSRPLFTNSSGTMSIHNTTSMPGTGRVSATAGGTLNRTTLTQTATVPTLTMTATGWMSWKPSYNVSVAGTGDRSPNSINATGSIWRPMPTRGPPAIPSIRANSTLLSASPTSVSYYTTRTFVFSDTTISIPIPAGYTPSLRPDATTNGMSSPASSYQTSGLISSSLSTSSCWTTTAPTMSGTHLVTGTDPTKICWLLVCDDQHSCTDQITRYPITVQAISTSMKTSSTTIESMWAPWPTMNVTSLSTPSAAESKITSGLQGSPTPSVIETLSSLPSNVGGSSSISVEGTITRTVVPLPGPTTGAVVNRKRYIKDRSDFKAAKEEQKRRDE